jgi:hypothetical protein
MDPRALAQHWDGFDCVVFPGGTFFRRNGEGTWCYYFVPNNITYSSTWRNLQFTYDLFPLSLCYLGVFLSPGLRLSRYPWMLWKIS